MAIPKFLDDLAFIQKLGDNPNTDDNLTSAELKARFDAAAIAIQKYINDILIPNANSMQTNGLVVGETAPAGPALWFNTSSSKSGDGILTYVDPENVQYPLYPVTKVSAVEGAVSKTEKAVVLPASGWSGLNQTVSVEGVTADNTVIVTPAPDSYTACLEAGVYCSGQGAGTLTFTCSTAPSASVTYNILILE